MIKTNSYSEPSKSAGLVQNKVALVTGAASGIGRAAALLFAREGAKVLCADIDTGKGRKIAEDIVQQGGEAIFCRCDVSKDEDVKAMIALVLATYGRLDCAFNNAGIPGPVGKLLCDYGAEEFDRTIDINLRGVWSCMRHQIPLMVSQGGGAIVNTASIGGLTGYATLSAYTAAKHGVVGITKTAATEYACKGIRINVLCPAGTESSIADDVLALGSAARAAYVAAIPLGRMAEPREQAEAAVWLCSDRASFITGVALPVDGGILSHA
jgi:NAD(P)-dependent dehydrogenase (short-subunit alcohol dehydrogenase family)